MKRRTPLFVGGSLLVLGLAAAIAWRELAPQGDAGGETGAGGGAREAPVVVDRVRTHRFADTVEAVGNVRARESVTITATVADTVASVRFESGQRVAAGDVLVTLVDAEEQAALAEAQASASEARRENDRLGELAEDGVAPRAALDRSRSALERGEARVVAIEAQLADRIVRAPFAGTVGLRTLSPGAYVAPGDALVTLDDLDVVELDFSVPERFLSVVATGQRVAATAMAYPDARFGGEVVAIDSRIDPASRAFAVRASLPNADARLRPGMLLGVTVRRDARESPAVPEIAVVRNGTAASVYGVKGPGDADPDGTGPRAVRREVELGLRDGALVEVRNGLSAGDEIVVEGVQRLDDGATVKVVRKASADGTDDPATDASGESVTKGAGSGVAP